MASSDQLHPALLTLPLAELRERVELAERLALASRYASSALAGPAASAATAAGAGKTAQADAAGKTQTAPKAAPKAPPAPPAPPPPPASTIEDDAAAAFGDGDFGGGDEGDMLAGFVEELTPEQAKAAAIEIAKKVIGQKDKSELATAREIMQKYGVSKVSDIPDDKAIEAHTDFATKFPQYKPA